jgi:hypothetical protein
VNFRLILVTGFLLFVIIGGYLFFGIQSQLSSAKQNISSLQTQLFAAKAQVNTLRQTITPEFPSHNLGVDNSAASTSQTGLKTAAALQISSSQMKVISTSATEQAPASDVNVESAYWNTAWEGKDYELQRNVRAVNTAYYNSHIYITNEIDCVDMSCEVWDILQKQGIKSLIAVGNLQLTGETFGQCDHAWLMIPNSTGRYFALEATNGQLYFADNPALNQYAECFLYAKPSDLRADIGSRW